MGVNNLMNETQYKLYKYEQRKAARQRDIKNSGRGNAGRHKRNYLCLECRKAYNYTAIYPSEGRRPGDWLMLCPVHKTPLVSYVGHVPRRTYKNKWRDLLVKR